MARVLFVWELGGAYGHLARQLPVALELRARGHEPVFVVRDLMAAESLLTPHGFDVLQAPLWLGKVGNLPPALNYAEMLMRFGYLHPAALTGICRAWRHLLGLLQPALLVMDHAPTALLATRGMHAARLNLGDGFCIPPPTRPLPPFVWWQAGDPARAQTSEQQVLAGANRVLQVLDAPPLGALADLAHCDAQLLCTFAELDHYRDRPAASFIGPVFALGQGTDLPWSKGEGPRVFAYLNPAYPELDAVLRALHGSSARVLAHVPGAAPDALHRFSSERMQFSHVPLDIGAMCAQCDLAVGHGGAGTVAAMLLAGKPQLLLPMHMEQAMAVQRVVGLQAAAAIAPQAAGQLPQLLEQVLSDAALVQGARAFAARHPGYDQQATVRRVADRCEALMAVPGQGS
jgi:UDP:flavonoid glycosyltransferase YjiC (YdhE family)